MDNKIISRTIQATFFVAAFLFPFLALRSSPQVVWGFAIGALVSAFNLFLLSYLTKNILFSAPFSKPSGRGNAFVYAIFKFPLFLGVIALLLYLLHLSPYAFMAGFSLPLAIIVLKVVGHVLSQKTTDGEINDGSRTGIIRAA
jgi:hypothetical protein